MSDSDLLFGADDPTDVPEVAESREHHFTWRVLIVDDEEQVHKVTALVLNQCDVTTFLFSFEKVFNFPPKRSIHSKQKFCLNNSKIAYLKD